MNVKITLGVSVTYNVVAFHRVSTFSLLFNTAKLGSTTLACTVKSALGSLRHGAKLVSDPTVEEDLEADRHVGMRARVESRYGRGPSETNRHEAAEVVT